MNFKLYATVIGLLPILMGCSAFGTRTVSTARVDGFCDQDLPLTQYYSDIGPPAFKDRTEKMYAKHLRLCGAP